VARRLVIFGDLDASAAPNRRVLRALVAAVRRFQTRHGLTPGAHLGAHHRRAGVPIAARAGRSPALERRWLPGRARVVSSQSTSDVPVGREAARSRRRPWSMEVIVGRAIRHETPVFVETMDHVIFRPCWNVPSSIVRDEAADDPAARDT
jgi:murein L,D-transpeptidase YcbB/YkuD